VSEPVVAVILAGGTGSRFGGPTPKQLARLAGHPVLHHTLHRFDEPTLIDSVVVVANTEWISEILDACESALRAVPFIVADGGQSRNESVRNALQALNDYAAARVLVHDGVRPLVTRSLIERVAEELRRERCVIPVVPSVDPIVVVEKQRAVAFGDRSAVYRGQSPQGFLLEDLRRVFCDDTSNSREVLAAPTIYEVLMRATPGLIPKVIDGDLSNIKITMPVDHMIAGRLLLEEFE